MERGRPAIQPCSDSIPSFTEQDVRDYLSRGVSLGKIGVLGQPTVTQIVFTTIHDLGGATGDSSFESNYPADLPICYVELSGAFRVLSPYGRGTSREASTRTTAFIVFDARTGNRFLMGTPARATWA